MLHAKALGTIVLVSSLFLVDSDFRSAGLPTCRIADFQIGGSYNVVMGAVLEARDTADLEVCATPAVVLL
jgi:hypothetical protein